MPPQEETISDVRRRAELIVLIVLVFGFLVISGYVHVLASVSVLRTWPFVVVSFSGVDADTVGIILGAGLTLVMYSFLYRDNPLFKIAENLYVGVTLGYLLIITWRESLWGDVFKPIFTAPTSRALGEAVWSRWFPILLGLLLLTRLSRKHGWLSRYAYAWLVGWGAGIGIALVTHSFVLKQLEAAVAPLQEAAASGVAPNLFSMAWVQGVAWPVASAVFVLIGTVAVLFYFFFSVEHKGAGGAVSRVGIWFLMLAFGASYGSTVMARVSLLIGRVKFLLFEWLKVPQ